MFNCLPGAMLQKGHTHQWKKGFSCSRVPPQHNAWMTASHRLFNPGPPGGRAPTENPIHPSISASPIATAPVSVSATSPILPIAIPKKSPPSKWPLSTKVTFPNSAPSITSNCGRGSRSAPCRL